MSPLYNPVRPRKQDHLSLVFIYYQFYTEKSCSLIPGRRVEIIVKSCLFTNLNVFMQKKAGFIFLPVFCLALLLMGCGAQSRGVPVTVTQSAAPTALPTETPAIVSITGWFTTVWNGEPHFSISDDQGQTIHLVLDEALLQSAGGLMALNNQKVTLSGEFVSGAQDALKVLTIHLEPTQ